MIILKYLSSSFGADRVFGAKNWISRLGASRQSQGEDGDGVKRNWRGRGARAYGQAKIVLSLWFRERGRKAGVEGR